MNLKSTFIHLERVGAKTEKKLWKQGILSWSDYQKNLESYDLFFDQRSSVLEGSIQAYERKDVDFFAKTLPKKEFFRLALAFPEDVIFFDIETTGLSRYYDHITMIGWSINGEYDYYVQGLHEEQKLKDAFSKAKAIVTFNGSIFDLPFIENYFSDLHVPLVHIDLRFFAKSVGLSGGQKDLENQIGFKRRKSLKDTDGYMATVLWDEYKWGKKSSLEKLIQYNHSDVEGMKSIFDYCLEKLYIKEGFSDFFERPFKFTSLNSEINLKEIKSFVQSSQIPFDPMATLKYKELANKICRNTKIVGIDLTGSEAKASGVALLTNNHVETLLLSSDEDIIEYIEKVQPDLVSIDSPLSLPLGRISVFDDDPGRDKYGILRVCERTLKKRGVNAYPTLLPSMQKLTKRGIELADALRKKGVPTIESYPGVVQDIIGLPRKQASLKLLKKGLGKFGLKGEFLKKDVTHDEIDGITSAIVGLFFLSRDYEAIGELNENLMIIPDLNTKVRPKKIIGFTGKIATGKTTASEILKTKGFKYVRYSQILEKVLEEQGADINRENLQKTGLEMKQKQSEFSKLVYKEINEYDQVVIDGFRHFEDYAFFFEQYGYDFKLVYISSNDGAREERYIKNGATAEEFKSAISKEVESEIPWLKKVAEVVIDNNGNISSFERSVLKLIEKGC